MQATPQTPVYVPQNVPIRTTRPMQVSNSPYSSVVDVVHKTYEPPQLQKMENQVNYVPKKRQVTRMVDQEIQEIVPKERTYIEYVPIQTIIEKVPTPIEVPYEVKVPVPVQVPYYIYPNGQTQLVDPSQAHFLNQSQQGPQQYQQFSTNLNNPLMQTQTLQGPQNPYQLPQSQFQQFNQPQYQQYGRQQGPQQYGSSQSSQFYNPQQNSNPQVIQTSDNSQDQFIVQTPLEAEQMKKNLKSKKKNKNPQNPSNNNKKSVEFNDSVQQGQQGKSKYAPNFLPFQMKPIDESDSESEVDSSSGESGESSDEEIAHYNGIYQSKYMKDFEKFSAKTRASTEPQGQSQGYSRAQYNDRDQYGQQRGQNPYEGRRNIGNIQQYQNQANQQQNQQARLNRQDYIR